RTRQSHFEALAVAPDNYVALALGLTMVARGDGNPRGDGGASRGQNELAQVEPLLDPFRRVVGGDEVGMAEDGEVGGDRRRDALDLRLLEGPDEPAARLVA